MFLVSILIIYWVKVYLTAVSHAIWLTKRGSSHQPKNAEIIFNGKHLLGNASAADSTDRKLQAGMSHF